jgi:hypothetical protein
VQQKACHTQAQGRTRERLLFARQGPDKAAGIEADCGSNIQEFQYVQASVSALIFGYVGRWLAQPFRHDSLRETCSLTPNYEELSKFVMPIGMNGF